MFIMIAKPYRFSLLLFWLMFLLFYFGFLGFGWWDIVCITVGTGPALSLLQHGHYSFICNLFLAHSIFLMHEHVLLLECGKPLYFQSHCHCFQYPS